MFGQVLHPILRKTAPALAGLFVVSMLYAQSAHAAEENWVIKKSADGKLIGVIAAGKESHHAKLTFVYSRSDCEKAYSEFRGLSRTKDLKKYVGQYFRIELNGTEIRTTLRKVIDLENPGAGSVQIGLFILGLHNRKLVGSWEKVLTRTRDGVITIQFIGSDKTEASEVFDNEINNWSVKGLFKAMSDAYSMCKFG